MRREELRLWEAAALQIAARKGLVVVRWGKGQAYREVELNALVLRLLDEWSSIATSSWPPRRRPSSCLGRVGRSRRGSVDLAVRRVAGRAGLSLSAHVLRHTFVTGLVGAGHDLVLIAELLAIAGSKPTHRYSLPSQADRQ